MLKLKYLLLLFLFGWIHSIYSQNVTLTIESEDFYVKQGTFFTVDNISLFPSQSFVISNTSFSSANTPVSSLNGSVSKTHSFSPGIESFSGDIYAFYNNIDIPLGKLEKDFSLYLYNGVQWDKLSNFTIDTNENLVVASVSGVKLNELNLANKDNVPAQIVSSTINYENSLINIVFNEEVYNSISGNGALEVADFVYSLTGGNATLSSTTPTSISKGASSTSFLLGISLLGSPNGTEVLTIKPSSNKAIYDLVGNASLTAHVSSTLTLNNQLPTITQTSVNSDNTVVTITFSEAMTNAELASNYALSLSGGVGTLSSTIPSAVLQSSNVYSLTFSLSTPPNGSEILTVTTNNSILDASNGAVDFARTQRNTVLLNDQVGPLITSISVDENNRFVEITFNEAVYGNALGSAPIIASSLENIISQTQGGNLDLNISSLTATSGNALVGGETKIRATLNLGGIIPSGNEAYVITATATSTIYDLKGNRIQTQVSNNTFKLVEPDADGDGVNNSIDNCPTTANADQADADADGVGDVCDNAPNTPNANQLDTDGDGLGDVIDTDDDNDSVPDTNDAFPLDASESSDTDGDGVGDSADPDLDNDGVLNTVDNCLYSPNADQLDTDGDGTGNACDTDDDGDGFSDADEIACGSDPLDATSISLDTDADGIPDCIDTDDDNDGYEDTNDAFPLDKEEWLDTDADGIGNNADEDDDNDGILDTFDQCPNTTLGVNVDANGCEIFLLPANNFSVKVTSSTCVGSENGSISISAQNQEYSYTASISGQSSIILNASNNFATSISSLGAGNYDVCFTIAGIDSYNQCFSVTVSEPVPLSTSAKIDLANRSVDLSLKGSTSYNILLNGAVIKTSTSNLSLELKPGMNYLSISTDLDCQGTYFEEIFVSEDVLAYPNPTDGMLQLYIGGSDNTVTLNVYDINSQNIISKSFEVSSSRVIEADISRFKTGIYFFVLDGKTIKTTHKIIKN